MKSTWKALLVPIMLVALVLPRGVLSQEDAPAFKKEEIEQLVAPIALYPDALVAQILMASTYPLEVVEAARWVKQNPKVSGKALEDAMQQQKWDPSVKSLTAFAQVLDMMNTKLDMTQKLGDAFLGQQKEVLDAVQRLRGKADQAGNLKSSKEQTVTKAQEGGQTVIKIEPANPEVVYVPTYNPAVVYGSWPYPSYPPYYYYPPAYVPGAALFSFGVGMAVGAALWGGCNWGGGGGVYINHNNYNNFNKTNISNNQNWQHNSEHRRGTEYRDKGSQDKFGKGGRQDAASRDQFRGRAEQGRQDIQRGGDQFQRDVSAADRSRGGDRAGGAGDRGGGGFDRGGGAGDRGGGGFDRGGGGGGAFDGAGRGGGASTRDASSRGASSRASAGGGGGARAGGGGGGRAGGGGGGRGGRR